MQAQRSKFKTFIYSIFAVIIGIVVIRIFLKLVGANEQNAFASFWYDFSQIFISPWEDIYTDWRFGRASIELDSFTAMFFYIAIAVGIATSGAGFFGDTWKQFLADLSNLFFKPIEFLLISRFIFKITDANPSTPIVDLVYNISSIVFEPFANIVPTYSYRGMVIEIPLLIAIVVIIILDIVTEQLIISFLDAVFPDRPKKPAEPNYGPNSPNRYNPANAPLAPAQNITINVPQGYPKNYVDRRQVHIVPPAHPRPAPLSPARRHPKRTQQ